MYAGDITLISTGDTLENVRTIIQMAINKIFEWYSEWKIELTL